MPGHASPGEAMGPTTCLAGPTASPELAAGPTSRAEEPKPLIITSGDQLPVQQGQLHFRY